jgi:hypothetical protein
MNDEWVYHRNGVGEVHVSIREPAILINSISWNTSSKAVDKCDSE